jgi:hypothetical protein
MPLNPINAYPNGFIPVTSHKPLTFREFLLHHKWSCGGKFKRGGNNFTGNGKLVKSELRCKNCGITIWKY